MVKHGIMTVILYLGFSLLVFNNNFNTLHTSLKINQVHNILPEREPRGFIHEIH